MLFGVGEVSGTRIKTLESFVLYNHMKDCLPSGQSCVSGQFACRNLKSWGFLEFVRGNMVGALALSEKGVARDPRERVRKSLGLGILSLVTPRS